MVVGRQKRGRWAQGRGQRGSLIVVLLMLAGLGACLAAAAGAQAGVRRVERRRVVARAAHHVRNPLAGRAMWVWELPYSNGGSVSSIIATAHQYGIGTVMIKSSDGTGFWSSQFSPQLVSALHAGGLRVCAWQYVYGNHPITEAYMGADAVRDGADCLLIDAESEYQGKYISAQSYIRRLRALIGYGYPLALAGFPYIDYHPSFPYSVFLGPGGAQYNAPQMYWKDIGTSVDAVFAHTYDFNRIYQRPVFPLGQIYSAPPPRQIIRFRQLSRAYGAGGVSWWDWQSAAAAAWTALSRPAGPLAGYAIDTTLASIGLGSTGDLVVWAQEHLISAGFPIAVSGDFGFHTQQAVQAFQSAHGLTPDGVVGTATWTALLRYRTARITWTTRHAARLTMATRATAGGTRLAPVPQSAARPARRDEIAGAGGAGGHPGP